MASRSKMPPSPAFEAWIGDTPFRDRISVRVDATPAEIFDALRTVTLHDMPEVRSSQLIERRDDRAVIEQEAVARFLMFSKRVHLILEVEETPLTIAFKDRCGQSFERYEGTWSMAEKGAETRVSYRLTAKPVFDVPGWLLSRLLKRDASEMIERLRAEIAAR